MVNTSKILTVSYGTFSCTLEGFDDSFDTMKAIAEYFRDLAADDRYFGAEPPTPDADMLARIAEREIARRVDAHEDQGKIVLRAADAPALAAAAASQDVADEPAEPQQAPEAAEETAAPVADAPETEQVPQEPATFEPAEEVGTISGAWNEPFVYRATPEIAQDALPEEVIEETAPAPTIQAAEEPATPAEAVQAETIVDKSQPEPETPEAVAEPEVAEEPTANVQAASADADVDDTDEDFETAEEFFENSPQPETTAYYEAEAVEQPVTPADPESVAAKLNRIRSVVSQNEEPYGQGDYSEDEHAQDFLSDAAADLDAALEQDDAAELEADATPDEADTDIAQIDALFDTPANDDELADPGIAPDDADTVEAEADDGFEDTLSQLLADSIAAEEAEAEEPQDTGSFVSEETHADAEAASDSAGYDDPVADDDAVAVDVKDDHVSDDDEARAQLNARVVKVKREDLEATVFEEMSEDDETAGLAEATFSEQDLAETEDTLSPEMEQDLQRELAEVEADLTSEDEVEPETAETEEPQNSAESEEEIPEQIHEPLPKVAREGRNKLERTDGQTDLERIFDEADSQLEKPESNQRRSAIQHLRAAVAATRAEKKAGTDLKKDVDDAPYRSDLASVVRPRRPSANEGVRSARPISETRPAPLKLVAEQRIDTDREPIRPRRVSATEQETAGDTALAENESNFTQFAQDMGATQLPELLEAAAAYMSDVEGRAQFSRPMLMHKLQEVEQENFSREDGLRSFGQLLREGKIQKIKGGRFTVTDETDFRGEARHAG